VQATAPGGDNTMKPRTEGCIALLPTGNLQGSVRMWSLASKRTVSRDHFKVIPMPDLALKYVSSVAASEGRTRRADPSLGELEEDPHAGDHLLAEQIAVDAQTGVDFDPTAQARLADEGTGRLAAESRGDATAAEVGGAEGQDHAASEAATAVEDTTPTAVQGDRVRRSVRFRTPVESLADGLGVVEETALLSVQRSRALQDRRDWINRQIWFRSPVGKLVRESALLGAELRGVLMRQLHHRKDWRDKEFAMRLSVNAALREHGEVARTVIESELRQMIEKKVWTPMQLEGMTAAEKKGIIRSSMFIKEKFLSTGEFEKLKARLVAGGDQQDRALYNDLSSPTAATSSVFTVAAIAGAEGRSVMVIDIGGAYLNADMGTGIIVYMRLDKAMTTILLQIEPKYKPYVRPDGTMVVKLKKALYGCVEAALLWHEHLKATLLADGFVQNPHDACVYNKVDETGKQCTIVVHVDDLLITSENPAALESVTAHLVSTYKETKVHRGEVHSYLGITFDFSAAGEVAITMEGFVDDLLQGCGVTGAAATPASEALFEIRADGPRATPEEAEWFHRQVARILYLAKRVRPECLTAVAFLATRVTKSDQDDLGKLRRLLRYIRATAERGIVLRAGANGMQVRLYVDASYGVHADGKSHTGCTITVGDAGPAFAKSCKQKIVSKSSTEAELVAMSDSANQALHMRNFLTAQGYESVPVKVYQDNLSTMALANRGRSQSERSRHIAIRYFWIKERIDSGEVDIEHLSTKKMHANLLTKPVQGEQFKQERRDLTNWAD
jgi:hypothetical protein